MYLADPPEAVQLAAVRSDPRNIRHIENPTEKVQLSVLHADRTAATLISSPAEEVKKQAASLYGLELGKDAGKKTKEARTHGSSAAPAKRTAAKKAGEAAGKKPSAGQVKEAVEKLDREIQEINREYYEAGLEAQYSGSGVERARELEEAGERRERKLAGACEKFNSSAVPDKKGCDMGNIIRELRAKGVAVESMKAEQWNTLMQGKAVKPPTVTGMAGKGSALMLSKTPAGYTLKAVNSINSISRQAGADM